MCAVISVLSVIVVSSELSVIAGWATPTAEQAAVAHAYKAKPHGKANHLQ